MTSKKTQSRQKLTDQISRLYKEGGGGGEYKKINRPSAPKVDISFYKKSGVIILILAIVISAYFLFFRPEDKQEGTSEISWYAVRLVNEEMYYGQIKDVAAEPVVVENVYYSYDQDKDETDETGNLRLVKRGEEIHGPAGKMIIRGSQILYIEPLKDESKVLKAILSYEQ